ncbi:MAG: hypothetical protein HDT02_03690 [Bacteroidales bacterium]|nr:hypothetical protein [Bacteroidales bacterium]
MKTISLKAPAMPQFAIRKVVVALRPISLFCSVALAIFGAGAENDVLLFSGALTALSGVYSLIEKGGEK